MGDYSRRDKLNHTGGKKMDNEELHTKIGNEEAIKLKPLVVIVKEVKLEEVGTKKAKKLICSAQHPEADSLIKISSIKWENKGKLEVSGLWYNLDSKKLIRKGSALATFLNSMGVSEIAELVGKSINTVLDDKGYLAFKGY